MNKVLGTVAAIIGAVVGGAIIGLVIGVIVGPVQRESSDSATSPLPTKKIEWSALVGNWELAEANMDVSLFMQNMEFFDGGSGVGWLGTYSENFEWSISTDGKLVVVQGEGTFSFGYTVLELNNSTLSYEGDLSGYGLGYMCVTYKRNEYQNQENEPGTGSDNRPIDTDKIKWSALIGKWEFEEANMDAYLFMQNIEFFDDGSGVGWLGTRSENFEWGISTDGKLIIIQGGGAFSFGYTVLDLNDSTLSYEADLIGYGLGYMRVTYRRSDT